MQELVVIVQLVVLMLDGLNPVEDLEEGFLEDLCMLIQLCPSLLAHLFQVLTAPPGAHGTGIISVKNLIALFQFDARVLSRHDNSTARLASAHFGTSESLIRGTGGVIAVD